MILFFYGSLKRGWSNHHLVTDGKFLGTARTLPYYRIIDLGEYYGMIRDDVNGMTIFGELWEVNVHCLAVLDAFEGSDYPRQPVDIVQRSDVQGYLWAGESHD